MKEINPDLKDRRILAELDFNARESTSKMAKKIRISKEVALYRIRKLENQGYIKDYHAVIDNSVLGYYFCRLLVRFQSLSKRAEENILSFCKKDKNIGYYGLLDGTWDLSIGYWAKDLFDFENFVDTFVYKFGKIIWDKEVSIGLHVWQFPYRFLLDEEDRREFKTGGKKEIIDLDDVDKKLLVLLTKNARISFEELGTKLKLTGKAIIYRIKNLEKKKLILGYRTYINYKKFGYDNNKIMLFLKNLTKEKERRLINYLKSLANCMWITKPIGKADLEFEVLTKNRDELYFVLRDLKENFKDLIKNHSHFIFREEPISRFIPI